MTLHPLLILIRVSATIAEVVTLNLMTTCLEGFFDSDALAHDDEGSGVRGPKSGRSRCLTNGNNQPHVLIKSVPYL